MYYKKISLEYVWLDKDNKFRSKCRTLMIEEHKATKSTTSVYLDNSVVIPLKPEDVPLWNFDGSSTGQATTENSEVIIKPCAVFIHPMQQTNIKCPIDHYLVICDCYDAAMNPIRSNTRFDAQKIADKMKSHDPWFGIEQEYIIMDPTTNKPLGWQENNPNCQGPYYCSVGTDKAFGRQIVLEHYNACLSAGIEICGWNAEVMPSQWEFQIGICNGISVGDHLIAARYLLELIAEKHKVHISYNPKLYFNWNGSGCHVNYSTSEMRKEGGIEFILQTIQKFESKHKDHLHVYGENNKERLCGYHETSSFDKFTYGIADRSASIRIPNETYQKKCGYIEDRRPASNCDPYLVIAKMLSTTYDDE